MPVFTPEPLKHATTTPPAVRPARLVIAEDQLETLEALTTGFARRNPALADLLLSSLSRARIVTPERLPADVIGLGRPLRYRDSLDDSEKTVTLVLPEQADISLGRVSVMTPIGVALLGMPVGARAKWTTRTGEKRQLEVLEVFDADPATEP
ncbi:nucleoside diphosphate kinase regulator [Pseudodonghicola sp.]|uniref:nucleoside diphosphate kinase regulator n=1 Tax=Pseudodonghicola sp. TaxID=1969463 RepID=UPI003A985634